MKKVISVITILIVFMTISRTTAKETEFRPNYEYHWRMMVSVNDWREDHHLNKVELNEGLTLHAIKHSKNIAKKEKLRHSGYGVIGNFKAQGEVVGRGHNPYAIQIAFIESEEHKKIILGNFFSIGIGIVFDGDIWWVTYILAR